MPQLTEQVTIGELASRSGLAASALRYYEAEGLLSASRNSGNQRRYPRHVLRRIAFIRAAQRVGLTLPEIREALMLLPDNRTPTRAEWEKVSRHWQRRLEERIADLEQLKTALTSCIGCGCLSLTRCKLSNPKDIAGQSGGGARYLSISTRGRSG